MEADNLPLIRKHKLDETDIRILQVLQEEGRIPNNALALRTGLTPSPALRRTKALEQEGFILGYSATLDPQKFGFQVLAFVLVGLATQANKDVKDFQSAVRAWATVRECYALSGATDFLLKCLTKDLTTLQQFVAEKLLKFPNVETVRSLFCIGIPKCEPSVPVSIISTPRAS